MQPVLRLVQPNDILELFKLERRRGFQRLFELLVAQSGSIFEATRFSRACEISRTTVANCTAVLEATMAVHLVRPFVGGRQSRDRGGTGRRCAALPEMNSEFVPPAHMVPRHAAAVAKTLASEFPVIAIVGPRQAGKTTLARATFGGRPYVSLEEPDDLRFAREDP